jgi:hypothetical protein
LQKPLMKWGAGFISGSLVIYGPACNVKGS